ncbi:transposase [Micromonospora chalcea]
MRSTSNSKITNAVLNEVNAVAVPAAGRGAIGGVPRRPSSAWSATAARSRTRAHPAVGVDVDGKTKILGIWDEQTEGAKFWLRVMNDLCARGLQDVLIVACDGLVRLPAAIEAVWPDALVQVRIVHLTRASLR